jgi:hypothetical protein
VGYHVTRVLRKCASLGPPQGNSSSSELSAATATNQCDRKPERAESSDSNGSNRVSDHSERNLQDESSLLEQTGSCTVAVIGQGDVGQLGLGVHVVEVADLTDVAVQTTTDVIQVKASGLSTICLTAAGEVWTTTSRFTVCGVAVQSSSQ